MDVYQAIKERRSIRNYKNQEIEAEKIKILLDAARLAPSARNLQNWRLVVVTNKAKKAALKAAAQDQKFVSEAPVVIAACATKTDYKMLCGTPAHLIDIAIAMDHLSLAAVELGLGTCWIGHFKQEEVKKILNIPPQVEVVILMTVGYPEETPNPRSRKNFEELFAFQNW